MPVDYSLHADLALLFREWNAGRVARFLEVNPRSLQRWLKEAEGDFHYFNLPDNLKAKVHAQAKVFRDLQFDAWLQDGVEVARKDGLHDEVIASQLASVFKQLTGREIE